ncbi:MAG: glycogen synthase GlgA [Nitrospirae bacterium]|nr:glycogen synthase GlgA [Nitrospirota bacterium]
MRILYASSEVFPFAKTGGLADVGGSFPSALERLGHEVKVIMPKYAVIPGDQWEFKKVKDFTLRIGKKDHFLTLWKSHLPRTSVEFLFLSSPLFFNHNGLYSENGKDNPDNLEGFSVFSRAVLEVPKLLNWKPDILHANDWQTGLIFAYLKTRLRGEPLYQKTGTLFTIHNMAYQGLFPGSDFPKLDLPRDAFTPDTLEFYGQINFLKGGLVFADILNTVSPTYSQEILTPEYGCGLEGILQKRRGDLFGIINGADYQKWDPARDPYLPRCYNAKSLEGKSICKKTLQGRCKFPQKDVPLVGIISRLTAQKGIDLVLGILEELMCLDLQVVILGLGEPDLEKKLLREARRFNDRLSVHLTFDESFAHRVEAGADLFLMPSRYEPCGLSQIYSLRYGTIPVVRKTGGLADTIIDATPSNILSGHATGFMFETASPLALLTTLRFALCLFKDRPVWNKMVQAAMAVDFSWDHSAREYVKLYERALKNVK